HLAQSGQANARTTCPDPPRRANPSRTSASLHAGVRLPDRPRKGRRAEELAGVTRRNETVAGSEQLPEKSKHAWPSQTDGHAFRFGEFAPSKKSGPTVVVRKRFASGQGVEYGSIGDCRGDCLAFDSARRCPGSLVPAAGQGSAEGS